MILKKYIFIQPEKVIAKDFFELIEKNRTHLKIGFPYTIRACSSLEKTKVFLRQTAKLQQQKKGYFFFIFDKEKNKPKGLINIKNINRKIPMCELGYFVDKNLQGKGIISKGVGIVIKFCFEQMKMNKIFICTDPENIGSQKVALKNGFIQEGILRNEFKDPDGQVHDVVYFGLLKDDYIP
ncbi:GNAT family N-acetyltransferase [Flavobacteriaceae bacterium M23B6Z8]